PKALKIITATFFSWLVPIRCLLWRLFSRIRTFLASVARLGLVGGCGFMIVQWCFPCTAAPLVNRLGVVYAVVKNPVQYAVEALGDLVQVLQCKFAFVQLSVD